MRRYSPSTGASYLPGIHSVIPADAVPINEEHFLSVIVNPEPGKVRAHDADGLPILIDPPQQPLADQAQTAHLRKTQEIDQACETAITSGFRSSALGSPHSYSSEITDQLNLVDAVSSGQPSLYPCRDENGTRLFREHSAEQLRQVSSDFSAFKLKLLIYSGDLKALLDSALAEGNLAAMEHVVWGSAA